MTSEVPSQKETEAVTLLVHYSFDTGNWSAEELVANWHQEYPASWIRTAIVEALYQGRYKTVSVEQILKLWQRRGQPLQHFNGEFDRIVTSRFPKATRSSDIDFADSDPFTNQNPPSESLSPEPPHLPNLSEKPSSPVIPQDNISHCKLDRSDTPPPIAPFQPQTIVETNHTPNPPSSSPTSASAHFYKKLQSVSSAPTVLVTASSNPLPTEAKPPLQAAAVPASDSLTESHQESVVRAVEEESDNTLNA